MKVNKQILNGAPMILGALFIPLLKTQYLWDNFTVIKWFAVYTLALLSLPLLLSYKKLSLPQLPKWAWFCFLIATLLFLGHIVANQTHWFSSFTADRLSLVVLTLYFFNYFRQNKNGFQWLWLPTLISTALVVIWGLIQVSQVRGFGDDFSSSFGNTNMTGQFLGFSILIQLFAIPWSEQKQSIKILRLAVLFITVTYLTLLMCRSVSLGLAFCAPLLFLKNSRRQFFTLIGTAALAVALGIFLRAQPAESLQRTKQFELANDTTNQRLSMWKQSLKIVMDHPFGIGPGAYEFGAVPYAINTEMPPKEDLVYKSPHNEILRILVEDGVPFFLIMLPLWLLLILSVVKKPLTSEAVFYLAFAILWGSETFFQFPFENSYPSFLFTVMAGRALSFRGEQHSKHTVAIKSAAALALLCLFYLSYQIMTSKYLEATAFGNAEKNKEACETYPDNWRPCLEYAKFNIERRNWYEADRVLRMVLGHTPYNFPAIKIWGVLAARTGHIQESCEILWIYDQIFSGKSSVHDKLMPTCAEVITRLSHYNVKEIYPKPLPKLSF